MRIIRNPSLNKYYVLGIVVLVSLLVSLNKVHSNQISTPTPAPSKTADPDSNATPNRIPEENPQQNSQPFTQSDLNTLTGNVQRPNGITWFNDMLYTVCNGDWTIYELHSTDGTTQTYIYGVRNAHALLAEETDSETVSLWVPDFDTGSLLYINQNRSPQTIASNLVTPWGIASFDSEHFVITSLTGNNALIINRNGDILKTIDGLRSPTGVASDEEFVYIANNGSSRRSIEWVSKDDILENESTSTSVLVYGLQNTTGLVLGSDGLLYFAFALGTRGVVGRVNPEICMDQDGGCSNEQIEIVLYTELAAPLAGLTISPDLRLYVHTLFRPEIYWVQLEQRHR